MQLLTQRQRHRKVKAICFIQSKLIPALTAHA